MNITCSCLGLILLKFSKMQKVYKFGEAMGLLRCAIFTLHVCVISQCSLFCVVIWSFNTLGLEIYGISWNFCVVMWYISKLEMTTGGHLQFTGLALSCDPVRA